MPENTLSKRLENKPLDPEAAHLAAEAARDFPTAAEGQYPLPPSTIAASRSTDTNIFEREMEQVFYRSRLPACPEIDRRVRAK